MTAEEVNEAFAAATAGPLAGVLRYNTEPIVSRDIIGDPASCVFDSRLTQASGALVKVFGWYDNECGYTCTARRPGRTGGQPAARRDRRQAKEVIMATMPVVAAVDGSEESLRAVEWAALEAQRHSAPLRIVSAPALPPRMRARNGVPQTVADQLSRRIRPGAARGRHPGEGSLLAAAHRCRPAGRPARARGHRTAARGRSCSWWAPAVPGGSRQLLLGSVSRYAAMHAACPVDRGPGGDERGAPRGRRRRPRPAATPRRPWPSRSTRPPCAARPWSSSTPGTALPAAIWRQADAERLAAEADASLAEALEPWREKYPGVPVRHDVVHGHPARVLAAYAGRADLVVIGRHSGGHAIGGIQHAVLSHAHGPVAIVPDRAVVLEQRHRPVTRPLSWTRTDVSQDRLTP